ncbi:hypothetical protein AAF712_012435 [Marasmius tenuissimus]|uniref:Vitellogenin n=1 Tax=Marasmius tenuissimus TaxID=585030 RepID=A0ABR2ZK07_9AGAR
MNPAELCYTPFVYTLSAEPTPYKFKTRRLVDRASRYVEEVMKHQIEEDMNRQSMEVMMKNLLPTNAIHPSIHVDYYPLVTTISNAIPNDNSITISRVYHNPNVVRGQIMNKRIALYFPPVKQIDAAANIVPQINNHHLNHSNEVNRLFWRSLLHLNGEA